MSTPRPWCRAIPVGPTVSQEPEEIKISLVRYGIVALDCLTLVNQENRRRIGGEAMKKVMTALAAGVCVAAMIAPVQAQAQAQAQEQARDYRIPAGSLRAALDSYVEQSGRQVIYRSDEIANVRSPGYRGRATAERALDAILANSGFIARRDSSGAIAIARAQLSERDQDAAYGVLDDLLADAAGATPEILVTGRRAWSLNTDIIRSRDDAQPYVVFDRQQIERSGATNLDEFFRDNLNANAGGSTAAIDATRTIGGAVQNGRINLRGLGSDETVILVDGRRIASGPNEGVIGQPQVGDIPIGSIERIEVLASSASGIYGGSASGGVINIVLKRDYRGLEVNATTGATFGGDAWERQIDVSGGMNLFGGGTNVMVSGSWRKNDPFYYGDAPYLDEYRVRGLSAFSPVPLGATPNFRSVDQQPLRLDAAYGGTLLTSNNGSIPFGYRGLASDGIAPLLANIGTYNLDLPDNAQSNRGRFLPVSAATENLSGTLAVRQEVTPWLKAFVEVAGSQTRRNATGFSTSTIELEADAPNNPFTTAINVVIPRYGVDLQNQYRTRTRRLTGGLIAQLPFGWSGSADYSESRNWFRFSRSNSIAESQIAAFSNGSVNIFRDLLIDPVQYSLEGFASFSESSPGKAETATLRLAGPLPLSLPGGRPTLTAQVQRTRVGIGASRSYNSAALDSVIIYSPPRVQRTDSGYFEALFPLFSPFNNVPFLNTLEFQVAGRYERYVLDGALASVECYRFPRPLNEADLELPCPSPTTVIETGRNSNSAFSPTISVRWKPISDVTLRASFATGYRPPNANELIPVQSDVTISADDPLRGNEPIGFELFPGFPLRFIPGVGGGNPDVEPERATSYTAGLIVTPRFIPNLRLSVDWTRIRKRDNYFFPTVLFAPNAEGPNPAGQALFNTLLEAFPERFVRAPRDPSDPFSVGPINFIDGSLINLSGTRVSALDFALDYEHRLGPGTLAFSASATWLYQFDVQILEGAPFLDFAGVAEQGFFGGEGGGAEWRGNAELRYWTDRWSLGARAHYFGGYRLSRSGSVSDSAVESVPSQTYFDLFGTYRLFENTELRAGARNVFNTKPPYDGFVSFSPLGDPRRGTWYLSVSQRF